MRTNATPRTVGFGIAMILLLAGCAIPSGARIDGPAVGDPGIADATLLNSADPAKFAQVVGVLEDAVDLCMTNIANAESTAYKRTRPTLRACAGGVRLEPERDHRQGALVATGNRTDLAIEGPGLLPVQDSDGSMLFTRGGSFRFDPNGTLVTHDGRCIEPGVVVPPNAVGISIEPDGVIRVTIADDSSSFSCEIAVLHLVRFVAPSRLEPVDGGRYFRESTESGAPAPATPGTEGTGSIRQGFLEQSNVRLPEEAAQVERIRRLIVMLDGLCSDPRLPLEARAAHAMATVERMVAREP